MPLTLAYPIRLNPDGQFATVEQGTPADLVGQVHLLISTPRGFLTRYPDMGLGDQAHLEGGVDVQEVESQIDQFVPDADTAIEEDVTAMNEALDVLNITVSA